MSANLLASLVVPKREWLLWKKVKDEINCPKVVNTQVSPFGGDDLKLVILMGWLKEFARKSQLVSGPTYLVRAEPI